MVTKPQIGDSRDTWGTILNAALDDLQGQITANGGNIAANTAGIAALQPTNFGALDSGYKAWTFPAEQVVGGGSVPGAGVVTLGKVLVNSAQSVSGIALYVATAGTTLTSGQNFAGVYNSSGALVATTADLTAAWGGATGWKNHALVGAPIALSQGAYWVAIMSNGTTPPTFGRNGGSLSGALYNGLLPNASLRFATNGTGTTALPSSITPSSNVSNNVPYWLALA